MADEVTVLGILTSNIIPLDWKQAKNIADFPLKKIGSTNFKEELNSGTNYLWIKVTSMEFPITLPTSIQLTHEE